MKPLVRWLMIIGLAVLGLLVVGLVAVYAGSQQVINRSYHATAVQLPQPDPALLADGARQARIIGCTSCHGADLQGTVVADIPLVARIESPSLLFLVQSMSDQQLAQAIRQAIGRDGRALWVMPAVPRMHDDELAALIGWLRNQTTTRKATGDVAFGPLGRLGILAGRLKPMAAILNGPDDRPPVDLGPEHERGRHLAETICAQCHGFMLQGMQLEDGSFSPDLAITAAYDAGQFRTLLRTGDGIGDRKLGLMSETSRSAFAALHDDEIDALYGYLKARAAAPKR